MKVRRRSAQYLMRLRRVKTAAFNKVWRLGHYLINVHSGITLENKGETQVTSNSFLACNYTLFYFYLLTFPVRMTTLVSGS